MAGKGSFPKPLVYFFVGLILLNLLSGLASDPDFAEDFPLFAAIGAFLLFRFFTSRNGNRRGPVPMPRPVPEPTAQEPPKDLGFKIPPLRGAPKDTQTEAQPSDEELDILRRESYERHLAEKQAREEKMEQERLGREHQKREEPAARPAAWQFSPDMLKNAVVLSEILAPPKALRKRVKS